MIEFDSTSHQDEAVRSSMPVTVIGIGGAGSNVLDTIALEGLCEGRLVCLNTDIRALQNSMAGIKIQLGKELTQGLGAGGDPELGSEAARLSAEQIRAEVGKQQVVFLCVGLGGGTGSGAAPLVARLAREEGAFVVVFAMMPFSFEGKRRVRQANEALAALRHQASALITFDNDRIGELVVPKKGIQDAFTAADKVVSQSLRALMNLVSRPGLIRIGMDDLITALRNHDSRCLFGYGVAKGEDRGADALRQALKSPLLDRDEFRKRASNVLVHVCGGPQMTFFEVEELMTKLGDHLPDEAQILFGTGTDPQMGDQISVTILTSLGSNEAAEAQEQPLTPAALLPHVALAPGMSAPVSSSSPALETVDFAATAHRPEPALPLVEISAAAGDSAQEGAGDEFEAARLESSPFEECESEIGDASEGAAVAVEEELETAGAVPTEPVEESPVEIVETETALEQEEPLDVRAEMHDMTESPQPESPRAATEDPDPGLEGLDELEEEEKEEPPKPKRTFHLREISLPKGRSDAGTERPARSGKPLIFQSWRREQARINSLPPQPPEKVDPVSDFEDAGERSSPPTAPSRPATRLPISQGRPDDEGTKTGPAVQEQATFDESLQSLSRGRFEKVEPTMEDGQDLDVPAFLRRRRK
ncbi:MAG: cell division protein FtsZ [Verrucomicrobiales bacterium]